MTFQITVQPSGHQFACEPDETILAAAMRAGVGLPYGCKNGACGSCKGKVVTGEVTQAVRATSSDAGAINEGDWIGIVTIRSDTRCTWSTSATRRP